MNPNKQNLYNPTNDIQFQPNKIEQSTPNSTMISVIQTPKMPLTTTPMTPILSQIQTLDGNKYNHIAQFQQQQNLLNKPFTFTTQKQNYNNQLMSLKNQKTPQELNNTNLITNRSNSFLNTYPVINHYNHLAMTPTINFNNRNNFNSVGQTSAQSLIYSTSLTNLSNLNTSNNNLFETEQDILDKNFLNLLENRQDNQMKTNITPSSVSFSIGPSNLKKPKSNNFEADILKTTSDLIDLNVNVDAIDEFDPLAEKKTNNHKIIVVNEPDFTNLEEKNQESATKALPKLIPSNIPEVNLYKNKKESFIANNSNDKTSKLKRIDHFELVDVNQSNFQRFNKMVNELKLKIDHEKKELSDLIVFTPLLEFPISNKCRNIQLNIRYDPNQNINNNSIGKSFNNTRRHQFSLQVSLNATVETVVYNVLMLLDINDFNTEKFLLKIHGLEEFLPINATLADLKYIHNCIIENKEPVLVLEELKNVNIDLSKNLTKHMEFFKFEDINFNSHLISKQTCENILKSIIQNRNIIEDKIKEDFSVINYTNHLDGILNSCINLKEKLKRLNEQILKIGFESIVKSISDLEYLEKQLKYHQTDRYDKNEKQPLIFEREKVNNENGNYYDDDSFKKGITDNNLQSVYKKLIDTANQCIFNVYNFLNCCSYSFCWRFNLKPITNNENLQTKEFNKLDIIQSEQKIVVNFNGMSRLGHFLNNLPQSIR